MTIFVKRASADVSDSCSRVNENADVGIVCFGRKKQNHTAMAG